MSRAVVLNLGVMVLQWAHVRIFRSLRTTSGLAWLIKEFLHHLVLFIAYFFFKWRSTAVLKLERESTKKKMLRTTDLDLDIIVWVKIIWSSDNLPLYSGKATVSGTFLSLCWNISFLLRNRMIGVSENPSKAATRWSTLIASWISVLWMKRS